MQHGSSQLSVRGNLWRLLWKPILSSKVEICINIRPYSFLSLSCCLVRMWCFVGVAVALLKLWGKSQGRSGTVLLLDFWSCELTNSYCLSQFLLDIMLLAIENVHSENMFVRLQDRSQNSSLTDGKHHPDLFSLSHLLAFLPFLLTKNKLCLPLAYRIWSPRKTPTTMRRCVETFY